VLTALLGPRTARPTHCHLQWFESIDTDRSGHLDAKELQRALALGNLNFTLTDVRG